jgi:hypothetical protein
LFQEIGIAGEKFVIKYLVDNGYHVEHVALYNDQAGYDLKCEKDGKIIFIEVKTTIQSDEKTPFYLSRNEKLYLEKNFNSSFIYRVYEFDLILNVGKILIISAAELMNYHLEPINYQVIPK